MQFQRKTLPNGLRVIVVPMPYSLTATVLVLTATGSKYETKKLSGVSHFLEHMCFKGTVKRPSADAISEELDGLGARYNAFTDQEYTGYYAKVEKSLLGKALDVVADLFQNATLPASEMDIERGVIVGEIEMYEDTPQDHVADVFMELLYGDQPAGWNVAGTRETARGMTRDEMAEYRRAQYVAEASVVVIAGNVDEKTIWDEVAAAFADAPHGARKGKPAVDDSQSAPVAKVAKYDSRQTHLILGFRSFNTYDDRQKVARLLAAFLGGGMSSRLFKRVRDKMGAGYYIGADNTFRTDHGFFSVATGVDNKRVKEVVSAVLEELARAKNELLSSEELTRTKNFIVGNLFSGLETSDSQASFYGGKEILGRPMLTPEEIAGEVRAVTAEEIRDLAREIFVEKNLNLALVGPYESGDEFLPLLKI